MNIPPLVAVLIDVAKDSLESCRARISNVRDAPLDIYATHETILFDFDGKPWRGDLKGRNHDLLIGFGEDRDKAIALRSMLDGDAKPVE